MTTQQMIIIALETRDIVQTIYGKHYKDIAAQIVADQLLAEAAEHVIDANESGDKYEIEKAETTFCFMRNRCTGSSEHTSTSGVDLLAEAMYVHFLISL